MNGDRYGAGQSGEGRSNDHRSRNICDDKYLLCRCCVDCLQGHEPGAATQLPELNERDPMIVLLTSAICSFLGAWGGSRNTSRAWRWLGIPLVLVIASLLRYSFSYLNFLPLLCAGPLSLGYGEDAFLRKLFRGSNLWTRLTIGVLSAVILFFVNMPNWWVLYIPAMYVLWGVLIPGEPVIRFGKYEILVEDLLIYWSYGLGLL